MSAEERLIMPAAVKLDDFDLQPSGRAPSEGLCMTSGDLVLKVAAVIWAINLGDAEAALACDLFVD